MANFQSKFTNPKLEQIFNLDEFPEVTLEIEESDWNNLLIAFDKDPDKNFFVPGNFVFKEHSQIPDQTLPSVALRVRGNSSRNRPEGNLGQIHDPVNPIWRQTSFALQFGKYVKGQTFEGSKRLDLKFIREDPTRIREVYGFDLYQQAGIYSGPLISMCKFYIRISGDTDRAYFGVYKLKEYIEDDYLEDRKSFFGDEVPGSKIPFLWKAGNGAAFNNYAPSVIENKDIYDLRINTSSRDVAIAQLTDFVRNLVVLEGDDLKNWANETMDVELLLKSYLTNVILGNMDDYWLNSNNFSFYFNTYGKFFFIPNDFDTALGTGWGIDAGKQDTFNWGNPNNPLIQKLITIDDFKQLYINSFYELTNEQTGPFHVSKSIPRIKRWQSLISGSLWDETIHFGCENDGAGCILSPQGGNNLQTPFEDKTAWWTSGGNNPNYLLLEQGENNFFEVSGDQARMPKQN
ncbi:MAG: CotH kinase family protein [Mediterranea sp.]|jgi:spore coat protein CotH|nr:CotH kinase family protein [Mediterranea sp.]